jgi:hypothetical protein
MTKYCPFCKNALPEALCPEHEKKPRKSRPVKEQHEKKKEPTFARNLLDNAAELLMHGTVGGDNKP